MKKLPRRQMLKALALSSVTAALPKLAAGSIFSRKKPIREFGRIHDYLMNASLRLEEKQRERITIENAEFGGEAFINVAWGYYDFIHCHFPASHNIILTQLANCNFIDCEFGPSASNDAMQLGECRDVTFTRCKFNRGSVVFNGKASFEACTFSNKESPPAYSYDRVSPYILAGDEVTLVKCRKKGNFTWRGDKRLVLQNCVFSKDGRLGSGMRKTGYPYEDDIHKEFTDSPPDFSFLDSTFEDAKEVLWGAVVQNLTISRCVAKGIFRAQGCEAMGTILWEHLSAGHFDLWGGGSSQTLHIRDCQFNVIDEKTEAYFRCIGGYSKETLIERVSAGGLVNLTTATDKTTEKFRYPKAQNDLFIVRDCKIPLLKINWLQSASLRLENCEIGQLEIRDGQIGKLEIRNTKFERLDLSRTVATEYAIDASGEIIDTGSNYDKGKTK
jgi:hypothetical protein